MTALELADALNVLAALGSRAADLGRQLDVLYPDQHRPSGGALRWTERLRDGTIGYYVRVPRKDDCWTAAVATCLQVPIEDVPDAHIDASLAAGETPDEIRCDYWTRFRDWLAAERLRMSASQNVPLARRRWIGVVPQAGEFNDHSLVMEHGRILFDPVICSGRQWTAAEVQLGFSFNKIPKRRRR